MHRMHGSYTYYGLCFGDCDYFLMFNELKDRRISCPTPLSQTGDSARLAVTAGYQCTHMEPWVWLVTTAALAQQICNQQGRLDVCQSMLRGKIKTCGVFVTYAAGTSFRSSTSLIYRCCATSMLSGHKGNTLRQDVIQYCTCMHTRFCSGTGERIPVQKLEKKNVGGLFEIIYAWICLISPL